MLHPRNTGLLEHPDAEATVINPQCGDSTTLYLKIAAGAVAEVRWRSEACGMSLAAISIASDLICGMPVPQLRRITRHDIEQAMGGLTPAKLHCAILAADAIKAALRSYDARHPGA